VKEVFITILLFFWGAGIVHGAEPHRRFVKKFQLSGSPEIVVVAEGEYEPRSIGSYSVRIYSGRSSKFPFDDFVAGFVMRRNGIVEAVKFDDLDGDGRAEVVVIVRAVGTGGYISADAFRYRNRSLELAAAVADLDKRADPIQALRDKLKTTH
jgi:PliI/PliC-like inhibitor of I-type lysozyme